MSSGVLRVVLSWREGVYMVDGEQGRRSGSGTHLEGAERGEGVVRIRGGNGWEGRKGGGGGGGGGIMLILNKT